MEKILIVSPHKEASSTLYDIISPLIFSGYEYAASSNEVRQKMDDVKVIERAKFSLIKYLGLNENQAHRYIQKQAMDLRVSPRVVADNILRIYEV